LFTYLNKSPFIFLILTNRVKDRDAKDGDKGGRMKIFKEVAWWQQLSITQFMTRLFFFWGMLYAPPISFESVQVNTNAAQSIRECMRAYGELRALMVGVYSNDEAIAYGSRIALMCCSLARYVNAIRVETHATCSCDDLEYVARLVMMVEKDCAVWRPTEARLVAIKSFTLRMLSGTKTVLEDLLSSQSEV
jgi:hypothetical protein